MTSRGEPRLSQRPGLAARQCLASSPPVFFPQSLSVGRGPLAAARHCSIICWTTGSPAARLVIVGSVETIILPRHLVNQILDQALTSPDVEVCGLIAARDGRPVRAIPISNVSDQPQRLFVMDPASQIDALRRMREQGEELFGIYHSHPHSPAEPSATDLEKAGYPQALYLIVSLNTRGVLEMRGFRLQEGKATQVQLEI